MIEKRTQEILGSISNGISKVWNPISVGIGSINTNALSIKLIVRIFVYLLLLYSFFIQTLENRSSMTKIKSMLYCYLFFAFDFMVFTLDYIFNSGFISANPKSYLSYKDGISLVVYCIMLVLMIRNIYTDDDGYPTCLAKIAGVVGFITMLILMGALVSLKDFIIVNNMELRNMSLAIVFVILIAVNYRVGELKDFCIFISLIFVICLILAAFQYSQRHHIIFKETKDLIEYEDTNFVSIVTSLYRKLVNRITK